MSRKAQVACLLAGVMLVAVAFRFYDLQNYPPGLFPDEAANGEDAQLILAGDVRPFYERSNGREALFFYLQALMVWLFGVGVWQMHAASAVVGTLTILAIYFATRIWFGKLAGLLAALLLATSHWHVTLSRTGFRAIMVPLFVALFTAAVGYTIAAVRRRAYGRSYGYAILAGLAFAGGFYTYIAYRVIVGVVGGIVLLLGLAALHPNIGWPHFRRYGTQLLVGLGAALFALLPLAVYFVDHPADLVGRAGQVSVFNPQLQDQFGGGTLAGTILYSLRETLLSFFVGEGDRNWRHAVAGFPLLNPLVGFLFLLGVAWSLRGLSWVFLKIRRGDEVHLGMIYPYLLLLLVGMLLPVITTAEGMPHALRSVGLIFPIFCLAGTAAAVVVRWLAARWQAVAVGLAVGALSVAALYDGALYFGVSRNEAAAHGAYRADLTEVVRYIRTREDTPYLVLDDFSLQTPHFLLSDAAGEHYRTVAPEHSYEVALKAGEIIIFTQSTLSDADRYAAAHAEVHVVEVRHNRFGQEIMRVYGRQANGGEVEGSQDTDGRRSDLDA